MPSNKHSERNDGGGPAPGTGPSSKSSLLWAFQLRREHVHLVKRIENLDLQLGSYTSKSETHHQTLSKMETFIRGLQEENYILKNEITLVRTKLAGKIDDVSRQVTVIATKKDSDDDFGDGRSVKHATKQLESGFEHVRIQMQRLSSRLDGFKDDIAKLLLERNDSQGAGVVEQKTEDLENGIPLPAPASVSASTQNHMRPVFVTKLKYKKKESVKPYKESSNAPASLCDNLLLSSLSASSAPNSMPSPLSPRSPLPIPRPTEPISHIQNIFEKIRQEDRTLDDYFAFTSELRCQLPRRKQEGHIVEAFFDGITTKDGLKESLEAYLDEFGWVWGNLSIFCKPRALRKRPRLVCVPAKSKTRAGGNKI